MAVAIPTMHVFSQDNKKMKMVARKHSWSFQNLRNLQMFSSVNDSQYTVPLLCGRYESMQLAYCEAKN